MSLLILIIVILIVAAPLIYAVDQVPMAAPFPVILKVLIVLVAVLVILNQAGLLA